MSMDRYGDGAPSLTRWMMAVRAAVCALLALMPLGGSSGEELKYEPAVVQMTGTVSKGKREHPNGTWFDFYIVKLAAPASIKGDGEKDSFNVDEKGVKEIQVFSTDEAVLKTIGKLDGKKVAVTGTLFHAHTAWHVRELVMTVKEVTKSE
jgi:hypothetical protein